ncbi:outer membrane beta-barrel family protein [Flavihumibacter profundi]|uniref:outer membrane beta-barrel family protein n=1 Tax=Flavihumibacter profundi TaxID=2716883 RepID=UPI001CC33903|nr:outer membrane beta-barrel family protein [Flavihumibacter profundi]MBZ5855843.1 TonB-dependent receptor [Flavihumibacter profundi]
MTKLLLAIFLLFSSAIVFAQIPAGVNANRAGAAGASMNVGHFYGRIVDSSTNKGIEAASVQLIQSKFDTLSRKRKDTIIAGMLTDKRGEFSFENLAIAASYKLKISAIGYKIIEQKVAFELKMGGDMSKALSAVDKDLGNLKMKNDAQTLENVTVSASKPLISSGIDRKIFNVEKNINSAGGTAVDVMKNVPSLQVDLDGNVTLRNASPQIFVDGRPTTLTLDQIPADAIATVEVITNPSAKYDASGGTSGILNIVLKKNKKVGYSGTVRGGVDERGKINAGGDINLRQNKVNLFANVNFNQRKSISDGVTERLSTFNKPSTELHQYDKTTNLGQFAFGRFGADYFINNRNTLTGSLNLVQGKFTPNTVSDIFVDTLLESGSKQSYSQRNSNTTGNFKNLGSSLGYKHNYSKPGKELTADLNFNQSKNENSNDILTNIYPVAGSETNARVYNQVLDGEGKNRFFTAQTDFVNPLTETAKLEMGLRAQFRTVDSRNDIFQRLPDGTLIPLKELSSQYVNSDRVLAGYTSFTNRYKKLGYQVGLRLESSQYEGTVHSTTTSQKDTSQTFSNNFPISLFPSVFLSYDLGKQQSLQLSYTRRINRPNFFQLFPFTNYSDSLNLTRGNPDLQPEFTKSLEMSYTKNFENNNTFLASVYMKHTTNQITRIQQKELNPISGDTVLINTYTNANSSYVGGLELTTKTILKKWWELNVNLNLYTSKINIVDSSVQQQDNMWSYFFKVNNIFRLPKNFTLQLSGEYTSKTILPPGGSSSGGGFGGGGFMGGPSSTAQGYVRPNYYVDLSLKYEFLKNKAAAFTLSWNDIFRTRISDIHSESSFFVQDASRVRDPQFLRLGFSYRFGKFDTSLFKKKNIKGEMQNMQNANEGVQF